MWSLDGDRKSGRTRTPFSTLYKKDDPPLRTPIAMIVVHHRRLLAKAVYALLVFASNSNQRPHWSRRQAPTLLSLFLPLFLMASCTLVDCQVRQKIHKTMRPYFALFDRAFSCFRPSMPQPVVSHPCSMTPTSLMFFFEGHTSLMFFFEDHGCQ